MAAVEVVERDVADQPACWCCGRQVDERDLTRLGAHPEVGVCQGCARWLLRRSRAAGEAGARGLGARARRVVAAVRDRVMRAGVHRWPLVGAVLRRLDRRLP